MMLILMGTDCLPEGEVTRQPPFPCKGWASAGHGQRCQSVLSALWGKGAWKSPKMMRF